MNRQETRTAHRRGRSERGAVLVEFGIVVFVVYLLLAVTIDFGRLFFTAGAVQDAARATARELAVIPLPAGMSLQQALQDPKTRARIYQPEHLVIDLDRVPGGLPLQDFLDGLPVLNQTLRPLMIFEKVGDRRLLRYPGALLLDPSTPSGFTVGIPYVVGRDAQGVETIRWVPILEEIRNPAFPDVSPFRLDTPAEMPQRGLVAIRINYPYQASMLSGYRGSPTVPPSPNVSRPVHADDTGVVQLNGAPGGLLPSGSDAGPYAGTFGLGRLYALGREVRPVRKLLSAQAIFRREVFE